MWCIECGAIIIKVNETYNYIYPWEYICNNEHKNSKYLNKEPEWGEIKRCPDCDAVRQTICTACGCGSCLTCGHRFVCNPLPDDWQTQGVTIPFFTQSKSKQMTDHKRSVEIANLVDKYLQKYKKLTRAELCALINKETPELHCDHCDINSVYYSFVKSKNYNMWEKGLELSCGISKQEPDLFNIQCDLIFEALDETSITSATEKIELLLQCVDYLRMDE